MKYYNYTRSLKYFLDLYRQPVAIRFSAEGEEIPAGYCSDLNLAFCQFVMMAQSGEKMMVVPDNLSCSNAAAVLGFRAWSQGLAEEELYSPLDVYGSEEAADRVRQLAPRLAPGSFKKILLSPLDEADFEPHVVILQGRPSTLMWVMIADNYGEGNRYSFSTSGSQGICVDVSIVPFQEGKLNLTLGCPSIGQATEPKSEECYLGVPFKRLEKIIELLPEFKAGIIKSSREHNACKDLQAKLESQH